jgi:hypothetical protein
MLDGSCNMAQAVGYAHAVGLTVSMPVGQLTCERISSAQKAQPTRHQSPLLHVHQKRRSACCALARKMKPVSIDKETGTARSTKIWGGLPTSIRMAEQSTRTEKAEN